MKKPDKTQEEVKSGKHGARTPSSAAMKKLGRNLARAKNQRGGK